MQTIIDKLVKIFNEASSMEEAINELVATEMRLSSRAARNVMLDIKDFKEGTIDQPQLSLYLQSYGFKHNS